MEMCVECFIFSSQTVKSMFVSDWKHIFFVFVSVSVCISALTCVCVVCVCSTGQISTCSGTRPTFPAWPTSDSPTVRSGGPTSCCTTGAQPRHSTQNLNCVLELLHDSSCSHLSLGSDCSTCSDYHTSRGGTQVAQVTDRLMFVKEKLNI